MYHLNIITKIIWPLVKFKKPFCLYYLKQIYKDCLKTYIEQNICCKLIILTTS